MEEEKVYKKQLVTFNMAKIVNLSLLMFVVPLVVCASIALLIVAEGKLESTVKLWELLIVFVGFVVLTAAHEGLHALGFILFGKAKRGDISFGMVLKQGMFYCTTKRPMPREAYLGSLLLPIIVTGIIPLIIVTCFGRLLFIFLFSLMISGGAGDVVMFLRVLKYPKGQMLLDHPKAPGYYLLYEEGKTPADFVEVTPEQEEEVAKSLKQSVFSGKDKNKGVLNKILAVVIFLIIAVAVMAGIGYLLTL